MIDRKDYYLVKMKSALLRLFISVLKCEEMVLKETSYGNELTAAEVHVLVAVGRSKPRSMSEVADMLMVNVSTLSVAVKKLEKKGFIVRIKDDSDRRIVKLALSEKGLGELDEHEQFYYEMVARYISVMDEDDIKLYLGLIEGMSDALQHRANEQGDNQEDNQE